MAQRLTLKAWDAINGAEGVCWANIDGIKEEMLYVKDIEANIKKNKSELKVIGTTTVKHKANGWSGTGKMTLYYATSKFRELMAKYMNKGIDTYFDLYIENEDPTSEIGKQTIWLKQVNIDDIPLAKLDVNSTELDEEINFTFNGAEILNRFTQLVGELI